MNPLIERYRPRWLYLDEFIEALPGDSVEDKREAVLLLIRDRLIIDGTIDQASFRFLTGKPQIEDATWLAQLSHSDIAWSDSSIRASTHTHLPADRWLTIEIAAEALAHFGEPKQARRKAGSPEVYDWIEIKAFFFRLLDTRGDPTDKMNHVKGWRSMADAMRAVSDHLEKHEEDIPEKTQLREKLNDFLIEWKSQSTGK